MKNPYIYKMQYRYNEHNGERTEWEDSKGYPGRYRKDQKERYRRQTDALRHQLLRLKKHVMPPEERHLIAVEHSGQRGYHRDEHVKHSRRE